MLSKERQLLDLLLTRTANSTVKWEPTAQDNEFVTSMGGEATVTVGLVPMENREHFTYGLTVRDGSGRELMTITGWSPDVEVASIKKLIEAARRAALNVDEKLDWILNELKKPG